MRLVTLALVAMTSAAHAREPEPGVYDPIHDRINGRAQGAVIMAFSTGMGLTREASAIQGGRELDTQLGADLGVFVLDRFELAVGYRWLVPCDSEDELVTTEGHRITFGPRLHAPVGDHWAFVFAVDAEATWLGMDVTLPEDHGEASDWAFGVTPTLALDALYPNGDIAIGFRMDVGWGFRTSHAYHAVRFRSEGRRVMPLDMGDLNLSGFEFGVSARVAFR